MRALHASARPSSRCQSICLDALLTLLCFAAFVHALEASSTLAGRAEDAVCGERFAMSERLACAVFE
eukprot:COSAG02_NODE_28_length_51367_cov_70.053932_53_plen_67_part_00